MMELLTSLKQALLRTNLKLKYGGHCEKCGYGFGYFFAANSLYVDNGCYCFWVGATEITDSYMLYRLQNDQQLFEEVEGFINDTANTPRGFQFAESKSP